MFFKYYWQFLVIVATSLVLLIIESIIKYFFILNKIPQEGFYLFGNGTIKTASRAHIPSNFIASIFYTRE